VNCVTLLLCKKFGSYLERRTYLTELQGRLTLSDRHTGMTLGEIAAQAATSGECELTIYAFSYIRFVEHPSDLQLHEGL